MRCGTRQGTKMYSGGRTLYAVLPFRGQALWLWLKSSGYREQYALRDTWRGYDPSHSRRRHPLSQERRREGLSPFALKTGGRVQTLPFASKTGCGERSLLVENIHVIRQ